VRGVKLKIIENVVFLVEKINLFFAGVALNGVGTVGNWFHWSSSDRSTAKEMMTVILLIFTFLSLEL